MPSLRELERSFASAVFAADAASPDFAIAGSMPAADRVSIYRNAIFANYRKALAATYPVVQRLVGVSFFNTAVDAFVRENASTSGDLNVYGDVFGNFLAGYPYAQDLPYLPDVARLEWAIDAANRAADHIADPASVLAELAAVAPERLAELKLRLAPSCRLVHSEYPILRLWQTNQPDWSGDDAVDLDAGGDALLVRRDEEGVTLAALPPAEFAFLAALAGYASLGEALDAAQTAEGEFDLGATLRTRIGDATIVAVVVL